jgi:hypothetical protein
MDGVDGSVNKVVLVAGFYFSGVWGGGFTDENCQRAATLLFRATVVIEQPSATRGCDATRVNNN